MILAKVGMEKTENGEKMFNSSAILSKLRIALSQLLYHPLPFSVCVCVGGEGTGNSVLLPQLWGNGC